MSKILRKSLVFVFALCLLLTVGLSIAISSPKALALGTLSAYADDLTMIEGASIYSKYEYGSEKETNTTRGIRFGMTMPKADYDSLLAKASDQGVTVNFGMFIKPNGTAYKYELSQANLFDNGALYYWEDNKLDAKVSYPTTNPTTGTPLYSWNAEIYNISRPEIEVKGDVVYLYGFLVGFEGAPAITRDYTCRGYVTLTKGESVTNVLANYSATLGRDAATSVEERAEREALVSRSMAEVAQGVIEKNPTDSTLISQLEDRYLTADVQNVATNYTVNYYLDGVKKGSKVLQGKVYTNLKASDISYDASYGYNCSKNLVTLSNASEINAVKANVTGKTEVDANFVTNHDFANVTSYAYDQDNHWKKCVCGVEDTAKVAHSGGTATYQSGKACEVCDTVYTDKLVAPFGEGETEADLKMFKVNNAEYEMSVNTNLSFVADGDSSFKFSAIPRWPDYYFSDDFVTWIKSSGYEVVAFKILFDAEHANTTLNSANDSWATNGLAGWNCRSYNGWISVSIAVSDITSSTLVVQLNKDASLQFDVYIDEVQFLMSGDFTGNESAIDLGMFTLSGNAQIEVSYDKLYMNEGSTALRLYTPSQWPRYQFTQKFVDFLKNNGYKKLMFDLYINDAGSSATLQAIETSNMTVSKTVDQWFTVTVDVSTITAETWFQFNFDKTTESNDNLNVYLDNVRFIKDMDYTTFESSDDLQMFVPTNNLYKVTVNTDTKFVNEGDSSFKFSANQKWPSWKFSSDFLTWLSDKGYETLSFKIYFDKANGVAFTTDSWHIQGLAGKDCATDTWLDVTVNVADLTVDTLIFQLNKQVEGVFNVYIDAIQYS